MPPSPNQRMFHGGIRAAALADQLSARFNDRQHKTRIEVRGETALVQIGSKHGTPVTVHIADTQGGVLVTMSRDRDWLDRVADASEMAERAASNPFSLLAMIPDVVGELRQENIAPQIWNAINDLCALTRSLAGERDAPANPKVCDYCGTANDPEFESCAMCGAALPVDLPRVCPKCGRAHTSEALFCQACGTRLVTG
ncbi:MAG: zinc ribbon domain-containing protein [Chloroflexota bacterium]